MNTILIILFCIVIFEILVKVYFYFISFSHLDPSRSNYLSKEYQPYLNWIEDYSIPMFEYMPIGFRIFNKKNKSLDGIAKINSLGFRTEEFVEKKEGELRILLIGASTAFGCGSSSNETTIAGFLEKKFNQDIKSYPKKSYAKVFNLAQVNSTSTQDIINLSFFSINLKPDIVIGYLGWNELISSYGQDENFIKKFETFSINEIDDTKSKFYLEADLKKNFFNSLNLFLNRYVFIYKIISKLILRNSVKFNNQNYNSLEIIKNRFKLNQKIFIKNIEILQKLSYAYNFNFYAFTQPYIYKKEKLVDNEMKVVDLYSYARPVHGGENFATFLRNKDIYKDVIKECEKKNIKIYNLINIFKDETIEVFYTLVHNNDYGYKRVADEIYKLINIK